MFHCVAGGPLACFAFVGNLSSLITKSLLGINSHTALLRPGVDGGRIIGWLFYLIVLTRLQIHPRKETFSGCWRDNWTHKGSRRVGHLVWSHLTFLTTQELWIVECIFLFQFKPFQIGHLGLVPDRVPWKMSMSQPMLSPWGNIWQPSLIEHQ